MESDVSLSAQYAKLTAVYTYIENNFANPITLNELSETVGITPQYLCALFKDITGITLFTYINQFRIKKSKELLMHSKQLTTQSIAQQCGFSDASYYCMTFKKYENTTPQEFRKRIFI